jgi:DnaK suppressor protein
MDAKKIKNARQRLTAQYGNLIESINRNRAAAEDIKVENTEDEGDLAVISHDKHLLSNLHEGAYDLLKFIEEAISALDRGQYGECLRCGKDINEKRLLAVPWATLCIRCQEANEADRVSSRLVPAGVEAETDF